MVQGRDHLSVARQVVLRCQQRRHWRFSRSDLQAGLHRRSRREHDLAAAVLSIAPLDDGYDIADYRGVHPDYGTLADAKRFIAAAHARGMRVITELVVNHTSDQHPWFQRARQAKPGSLYRDFYVWSQDDRKLRRHACHLHRHAAFQLDLGRGRRRLLLAPFLLTPAGPELRQSARAEGGAVGAALLARAGRGRAAPGRGAVSGRARRHQQREPA